MNINALIDPDPPNPNPLPPPHPRPDFTWASHVHEGAEGIYDPESFTSASTKCSRYRFILF